MERPRVVRRPSYFHGAEDDSVAGPSAFSRCLIIAFGNVLYAGGAEGVMVWSHGGLSRVNFAPIRMQKDDIDSLTPLDPAAYNDHG